MLKHKSKLLLILLLILSLGLAACGGDATTEAPADEGDAADTTDEGEADEGEGEAGKPSEAAEAFLNALLTADVEAAKELLCAADAAEVAEDEMPEDMPEITLDLSGLSFEEAIDGEEATVTVTGEFTMSAEDEEITTDIAGEDSPLPSNELIMVLEDGAWKACPSMMEGDVDADAPMDEGEAEEGDTDAEGDAETDADAEGDAETDADAEGEGDS